MEEVTIEYHDTISGPSISEASGSIKFQSNYLYYPNQEVIYEHGAVIISQKHPEGEFLYQTPPISITIEEEDGAYIPTIEITMVDLTGADYSFSGITTISVETSKTDYDLLCNNLRFPELTLYITTEYPSTWANWLTEKFEEVEELTVGEDYNIIVDITGNLVTVEFPKKEVPEGEDEVGYQLYLEKTTVAVAIKK